MHFYVKIVFPVILAIYYLRYKSLPLNANHTDYHTA